MDNPIEFSKRSRRAILVFLVVFLTLVLTPRVLLLLNPDEKFEFTQTEFKQKAFVNKQNNFKSNYRYRNAKSTKKFSLPKQKFDPNEYTLTDWQKLGLSPKQAQVILKFKSYKPFYSHEDLKKVFVISEDFFSLIKDSLVYPIRLTQNKFDKKEVVQEKATVKILDLNSASEEDLLSLNGIGPFFAKNIIKKRDELGGFYTFEQLLEVWKFDEEKLNAIKPFVKIDLDQIKKININTVTVDELKKHPYFKWNIANSIVKIRVQIGGFNQIVDIKRSVLVSEEIFSRVKNYIKI